MPITPADIQSKTFSEAKRGYQPNEVDLFLEEISKDVDAMLRKIADLKQRLTAAEAKNVEFAEALEAAQADAALAREQAASAAAVAPVAGAPAAAAGKSSMYAATEEQLAAALIVAQQTAARIEADARANAARITSGAEEQARKVIRQALDEKQTELDEIERLKASRETFRSEYLALLQKFQDAASANFPLMSSSTLSGSEAVGFTAAGSVIAANANPYGAQVAQNPVIDLD